MIQKISLTYCSDRGFVYPKNFSKTKEPEKAQKKLKINFGGQTEVVPDTNENNDFPDPNYLSAGALRQIFSKKSVPTDIYVQLGELDLKRN